LGIDLDEFEMVLEARMAAGKEITSLETSTEPALSSTSIHKLFKMMDEAEMKMKNSNKKKTSLSVVNAVEGAVEGLLAGGVVGGVVGLFDGFEGKDSVSPYDIMISKKKVISDFPISTIKEELIEFLSYAVPRAKKKGNFFTDNDPENAEHNEFVPIWKTKCEQIITKVKLSMRNDNELMESITLYAKELKIK